MYYSFNYTKLRACIYCVQCVKPLFVEYIVQLANFTRISESVQKFVGIRPLVLVDKACSCS